MKTEEILQTIKTFEETLKRYKSDLEKNPSSTFYTGLVKNTLEYIEELKGDWSGGTHNVSQRGWIPIDDCKLHKRDKNVGDLVWLDGYTSMAQQNAQEEYEIEKVDYKFDKDTGVKFPVYFLADRWFDGRDGGAYDDNDCMYYIEID